MLSIVIIHYNTFQLTCDCIQSIYRYTRNIDFEIILVDNASADVDAAQFLGLFPDIVLVKSPNNLGFARGNNLGITHAKGNFILLLNSDVYLERDAISAAYLHYRTLQNPGVLGVKMRFPDGSLQYTARRFRSISWELLDLLRFIPFLMPYTKRAKLMLGKYFNSDFDLEVDWLNGAFFMFDRSILHPLPGQSLDDRFFMYGEDHLWCWQILHAGYRNYFFSGTEIVHINNASTDVTKRLRLLRVMLNNELEIMRHRKGDGVYYRVFSVIYSAKENMRILFKYLIFYANKLSSNQS